MNPFDTYRKLQEEAGQVDSVTLDVPLLIRIMEVCREEIEDDKELHQFATQIVAIKDRGVLGMKDWDDLCTCSKKNESTELNKKIDGQQKAHH